MSLQVIKQDDPRKGLPQLEREAKLAMSLRHENVVTVLQAFVQKCDNDSNDDTASNSRDATSGPQDCADGAEAAMATASSGPSANAADAKASKKASVKWAVDVESVLVMDYCDSGTLQVCVCVWRGGGTLQVGGKAGVIVRSTAAVLPVWQCSG